MLSIGILKLFKVFMQTIYIVWVFSFCSKGLLFVFIKCGILFEKLGYLVRIYNVIFFVKCWGRFLVKAVPTLSRQYHGSCLPKAVRAECFSRAHSALTSFGIRLTYGSLLKLQKPCQGFSAWLGFLSGLAQGLLAWFWQGSSAFLCFCLVYVFSSVLRCS